MLSFFILILMRSPNTSRGRGRDSTSDMLTDPCIRPAAICSLEAVAAAQSLSEVNVVAIWNWLIDWFIHLFITKAWQSMSVPVFELEHFHEERTPAGFLSSVWGCTRVHLNTHIYWKQDLWFVHYYSRALSTFLPPSDLGAYCCMHRCIQVCVYINEMTPPYFCGLEGVCNKILFTSCHSSCEKLHRLRGRCCPGLRSLFLRRLSCLGN